MLSCVSTRCPSRGYITCDDRCRRYEAESYARLRQRIDSITSMDKVPRQFLQQHAHQPFFQSCKASVGLKYPFLGSFRFSSWSNIQAKQVTVPDYSFCISRRCHVFCPRKLQRLSLRLSQPSSFSTAAVFASLPAYCEAFPHFTSITLCRCSLLLAAFDALHHTM